MSLIKEGHAPLVITVACGDNVYFNLSLGHSPTSFIVLHQGLAPRSFAYQANRLLLT